VQIWDSLKDEKVELLTSKEKELSWYMCGPTVYDAAHLGHARTYVCFDVIARILEDVFGYHLNVAMNITDIDDKIIQRAQERGEDWEALARQYEQEFFQDLNSLNVRSPTVVTRVSEYIDEVPLISPDLATLDLGTLTLTVTL